MKQYYHTHYCNPEEHWNVERLALPRFYFGRYFIQTFAFIYVDNPAEANEVFLAVRNVQKRAGGVCPPQL